MPGSQLSESQSASDQPKVVLVVDDELLILELAEQVLERAGYRVVARASGSEAVDVVREQRVDIAVIDLNMPTPNGWETLAALHEVDPDLPVLMASGFGSDEEARERGALGLLEKPYSAAKLRSVVASMLEQHGR